MKPYPVSQQQEQEILKVYAEVSNVCETCRRVGLPSKPVYRILQKHNVKILPPWVRRSKFSLEVEKQIMERYQKGEGPTKLAREYGCEPMTIRKIRERHGVEETPNGNRRFFDRDSKSEMALLWKDGHSVAFIARHFKVSNACIRANLCYLGITPERRPMLGEKSHGWKGGRPMVTSGYFYCYVAPDDPMAVMRNKYKYVLEHRLIMARHLNRPLSKHETVHHINGNGLDNRIKNLQLRQGKHGKGTVLQCATCGSHDIRPTPL